MAGILFPIYDCSLVPSMQMHTLWKRISYILDVSVFSASADVIFVSELLYLHDGRIACVITDVRNAGCVANISSVQPLNYS